MVEISLSGSGEGLGRVIARGYSTKSARAAPAAMNRRKLRINPDSRLSAVGWSTTLPGLFLPPLPALRSTRRTPPCP